MSQTKLCPAALAACVLVVSAGASARAQTTADVRECVSRGKELLDLTRTWQLTLLSKDADTKAKSLALLGLHQLPKTEEPKPGEPILLKEITPTSDTSDALAKLNELMKLKTAIAGTRGDCAKDDLKDFITQIKAALPTNLDTPWCEGGFTWCTDHHRRAFNGIRFIAEPQLGSLFQTGKDKVDSTSFGSLPMVGFATDLRGRFLGLQIHVVLPTEVAFTDDSPIVKEDANKKNGLTNGGKNVAVEFGLGAAVTLFDGAVALGVNYLNFDANDFVTPWSATSKTGNKTRNTSFFMAIQPVTASRAVINAIKN